jgi:hypothetical protein
MLTLAVFQFRPSANLDVAPKEQQKEPPIVRFVIPKTKLPLPKIVPPLPLEQTKTFAAPATTMRQAPSQQIPRREPRHEAIKPLARPPTGNQAQATQKTTPPKSTPINALGALKTAFSGAVTLTNKSNENHRQTISTNNHLFDSGVAGLKSTEIKPGYSVSTTTPAPIGGNHGEAVGQGLLSHKGGNSFVSLGGQEMDIETGLLQEEVGAVIHKHMDEVRYCHEAAMLYKPNSNGKLVVHFSINPSGIVESAILQSSTIADTNLEACIIKKLKNWIFPKPKGGVHVAVSYPFLFKVLERN